jgi:hypothetical protein
MITIVILLVIYVVSFWRTYKWTQKAFYHPLRRWNWIRPNSVDVLWTICPLLNTVAMLCDLFESPLKDRDPLPQAEDESFFKPKNRMK